MSEEVDMLKRIAKLERQLEQLKVERDLAFKELDDETIKRILESATELLG